MNEYIKYFNCTVGNRDIVYTYFLNFFGKKPAKILEIGCARNSDFKTRYSDGWSSVYFAQYVNQFGGEHHAVDISAESLNNCRTILTGIDSRTHFHQMSGAEALCSIAYDAVLLDGGDDPSEMVDEMALISSSIPVLCDDFQTKGSAIRQQRNDFVLFKFPPYAPEMALYNSGLPAHTINIPTIHY